MSEPSEDYPLGGSVEPHDIAREAAMTCPCGAEYEVPGCCCKQE